MSNKEAITIWKATAGAVLLSLSLVFAGIPAAAQADEPLQGRVEETGIHPSPLVPPKPLEPLPVPVLPAKKTGAKKTGLTGKVSGQGLEGGAGDSGGELAPMEAVSDPDSGYLKGYAGKEGAALAGPGDPDADDQELMIEWDRWRNRFLHAIQSGMQEILNNPDETNLRWDPRTRAMVSRFPMGTVAWFSCKVTPDRRIVDLKILHPSGFPGYDQAVIDAVHALQGSSILRYPRNSRRKIVSQVAGIKTAEQAEYRYFKFGDVERHVIPGD